MPIYKDGTFQGGAELRPDGALVVWLKNNTGKVSVQGELVDASHSVPMGVDLLSAQDIDCIGAVYASGYAVGEFMPVVTGLIAQVLLQDNTSASVGDWVGVSQSQAGRAIVQGVPSPPTATIHFGEIGHCLENVTAGTNKLCRILMHFN